MEEFLIGTPVKVADIEALLREVLEFKEYGLLNVTMIILHKGYVLKLHKQQGFYLC